jgi:class 3 adenylate cyclase
MSLFYPCALKAVNRRLAAILAADVAGYSRLMSTHEEGTLERLKALRCALDVHEAMPEKHGQLSSLWRAKRLHGDWAVLTGRC